MPSVTRWFIKSSLIYLVAGLLTGAVLAIGALRDLPPFFYNLTPVYFHLFMVGWVAQLIFGVVYWLFPKYSRERPRGYEGLAWVTFGCLNAGLILRVLAEPLNAQQPGVFWGWALAVSAVLQWVAGVCFVINTWPRVRGRISRKTKES
jgi:cbb3-type cytochrome oxidase subunit 1